MAKRKYQEKRSQRRSAYKVESFQNNYRKTSLVVLPTTDAEFFVCPIFQLEGGVRVDKADRWENDRWLNPLGRPTIYFPKDVTPPKTCSYCGGAAPQEVLRLMREHEFEPVATTKSYKQYLAAPGYYLYQARLNEFFADKENVGKTPFLTSELLEAPRDYRDAIPQIKVYTAHFSTEEVEEFNKLVEQFINALTIQGT